MATKKKPVVSQEPVVIRGSHSTRTEYPDGRVEFVTHWDELVNDVNAALKEYQIQQLESIDPAERTWRTWHYDERGVKRKKDEPVKKVNRAVEAVVKKVTKTAKEPKTTAKKSAKITEVKSEKKPVKAKKK